MELGSERCGEKRGKMWSSKFFRSKWGRAGWNPLRGAEVKLHRSTELIYSP